MYGSSGGDELTGEWGSDKHYGGGGGDNILASFNDNLPSLDFSYGGGGNDDIYALDGNEDRIDCGKGNDFVRYDAALDTVKKNCEGKQPIL